MSNPTPGANVTAFRLDELATAIAAEVARFNLDWQSGRIWQVQLDTLLERVVRAARQGQLKMRAPDTFLEESFSEWPEPSAFELVCTLADANAWLAREDVPYRLHSDAIAPDSESPRARLQIELQRDAILKAISDLGLNALALPKGSAGCSGVRSRVWERVKSLKSTFRSKSAFENSWQRLLNEEKSIVVSEDSQVP